MHANNLLTQTYSSSLRDYRMLISNYSCHDDIILQIPAVNRPTLILILDFSIRSYVAYI